MNEPEPGVAIVVWRRSPAVEVLLLHRSHERAGFAGDWAWMTPGGRRNPEEPAAAAAARELREETGLVLGCVRVHSEIAVSQPGLDLALFTAEALSNVSIALSSEHDRFEWVRPEALDRCRPAWVREMYREVLENLGPTRGVG